MNSYLFNIQKYTIVYLSSTLMVLLFRNRNVSCSVFGISYTYIYLRVRSSDNLNSSLSLCDFYKILYGVGRVWESRCRIGTPPYAYYQASFFSGCLHRPTYEGHLILIKGDTYVFIHQQHQHTTRSIRCS